MPSLALRVAWFNPRIWEVIRSEIASPAASSLALLMCNPLDKRLKAVLREFCEVFRLRWALSDAMLVLMTYAMLTAPSLKGK
jgi:hypothetical protein